MSLRHDAEDRMESAFKGFLFFILVGCAVLIGAAWLLNNAMSTVLNPTPDQPTQTGAKTSTSAPKN